MGLGSIKRALVASTFVLGCGQIIGVQKDYELAQDVGVLDAGLPDAGIVDALAMVDATPPDDTDAGAVPPLGDDDAGIDGGAPFKCGASGAVLFVFVGDKTPHCYWLTGT